MYLAFDTETGGVNPATTSCLTAFFQVLNADLEVCEELEVKFKHQVYFVEAEALGINHIDLVKHDAEAKPLAETIVEIDALLARWPKLISIGHNVNFDISEIESIVPGFRSKIHYRTIDTAGICRFLILCGKLPATLSGLDSFCAHFGIEFEAHDAKNDTIATVKLLKELIHATI